jgi:hypothetical protein
LQGHDLVIADRNCDRGSKNSSRNLHVRSSNGTQRSIALHEVDLAGGFNSHPRVWRWDAAGNLILAALQEVLSHYDAANRLIEHFCDAGLPVPNLFREILVSGGVNSPLYEWLADTMRSVWPQLVEMGIATETAKPAETLASKVRSAVVDARSQIEFPAQVCAWARSDGFQYVQVIMAVEQCANLAPFARRASRCRDRLDLDHEIRSVHICETRRYNRSCAS